MPNIFDQPAFAVGALSGVVLGWITLWCFLNRWVGKIVARILAVYCIGFGIEWIATPLSDLIRDRGTVGTYVSPLGSGGFGSALGWGVGGLTVGILTLVLTFLGSRKPTAVPSGEVTDVRTATNSQR
jgi:hypothetical protein